MEAHAKCIPLSRQMCASYDKFIDALPIILHQHHISITKYLHDGERTLKIEFVGAQIEQPKFLEADGTSHLITPHECLQRNLSYCLPLYTDVHVCMDDKKTVIPSLFMGYIPLMIGSRRDPCERACPYDPGGYFIVKGGEKTIVFQKAHIHNCPLTLHRTVNNTDSFAVCCKSEDKCVAVTQISWNGLAYVRFPKLKQDITVGTLIDLLPESSFVGFTEEEQTFFQESLDTKSEVIIQDTFELGCEESERQQKMLTFCLPHTKFKADYIRLMMKQLYNDIRNKKWSDKDSLMFQRIEMAHDLLSGLTHQLLNKMTNAVYQHLHKKMNRKIQIKSIETILKRTTCLTDGLQFALATGRWNTPSYDGRQRMGVAQVLQRATVPTQISQLRRVSSSIKPEQKLSKPRFLHGQHRGRLCFIETPEGASVGLESQLTLGAYVSIQTPCEQIYDMIYNRPGPYLVFLNGSIVGFGSEQVVGIVRKARRTGQISKDVSVTLNDPTICVPNICIRTSSGRICRPLYILPRRNSEGMTFTQMLSEQVVEYLDVYEEYTMTIGKTHEEIDPSLMLGFCAATTPYSDRNPAPRNTYQAAMLKQAQSVNSVTFLDRFDTTNNILHYGQKPLVSTLVDRVYNNELPTGLNAIVAIMPWKYNQEDSIVINRYSIDRGFMRCTQLKTLKDTLCPEEKYTDFPLVNREVKKGDILLEKIRSGYRKIDKKRVPFEHSVPVEATHSGIVDKVLVYKERNGADACKVRIRKLRIPTLGDKFASRSAQKGTVPLNNRGEDLPFTLDGITPDIILNPHAIPSRMTMAQILECVKSKYGCYAGLQDGSPYNGDTAEDLMDMLHSMGFKKDGTQVMQCGVTGERFKVPIFIGPTFYQRLKHNAEEKIHARGRGRKDFLTRQPNEGRQHGGGLRVGEMEKDALLAHSVPHVLVERLMHSSDAYTMNICSCGLTHSVRGGVCNRCDRSAHEIVVPYAFKLLVQELQSMCIEVKLQ